MLIPSEMNRLHIDVGDLASIHPVNPEPVTERKVGGDRDKPRLLCTSLSEGCDRHVSISVG